MDFQVPKITHEEIKESRGVFVIEPLDRGFGFTFGNSLRRVLLSSLEGAAVTSVKIEGVAHEFTTLPGVREDVTDIVLNLKNLVARLHGDSPEVEVHIARKGPGIVTAGDIEAPAELEILNPELEIANLSDRGRLELTLTIGRGRGYRPSEDNKSPDQPIGVIPIDSIFSPVRRVAYAVEQARVGQRTDYDKLTLDVWTNGAVAPTDAVGLAAKLLKDHMTIFINFEEEPEAEEVPAERIVEVRNENLDRSVEELELSVRSYNCLKNANITTIRELVQKSEQDMLKTKNFGRKSLNEIKEILSSMGLGLGMRFDEKGNPVMPAPEVPHQL